MSEITNTNSPPPPPPPLLRVKTVLKVDPMLSIYIQEGCILCKVFFFPLSISLSFFSPFHLIWRFFFPFSSPLTFFLLSIFFYFFSSYISFDFFPLQFNFPFFPFHLLSTKDCILFFLFFPLCFLLFIIFQAKC